MVHLSSLVVCATSLLTIASQTTAAPVFVGSELTASSLKPTTQALVFRREDPLVLVRQEDTIRGDADAFDGPKLEDIAPKEDSIPDALVIGGEDRPADDSKPPSSNTLFDAENPPSDSPQPPSDNSNPGFSKDAAIPDFKPLGDNTFPSPSEPKKDDVRGGDSPNPSETKQDGSFEKKQDGPIGAEPPKPQESNADSRENQGNGKAPIKLKAADKPSDTLVGNSTNTDQPNKDTKPSGDANKPMAMAMDQTSTPSATDKKSGDATSSSAVNGAKDVKTTQSLATKTSSQAAIGTFTSSSVITLPSGVDSSKVIASIVDGFASIAQAEESLISLAESLETSTQVKPTDKAGTMTMKSALASATQTSGASSTTAKAKAAPSSAQATASKDGATPPASASAVSVSQSGVASAQQASATLSSSSSVGNQTLTTDASKSKPTSTSDNRGWSQSLPPNKDGSSSSAMSPPMGSPPPSYGQSGDVVVSVMSGKHHKGTKIVKHFKGTITIEFTDREESRKKRVWASRWR